jgi:hypothetical protein
LARHLNENREEGEVRTCRSEVPCGWIFYENARINAVIAK